ncbi:hypothetical protein [Lichenibacterium ramalinae]|uniref:hypothetical protein n=1 Tax=Lichenibacterium ramalinae TaxID=2316527 RepID=UPI00100E4C8E|nr:hypothetical protein [Lichenibacterium ramalinae]
MPEISLLAEMLQIDRREFYKHFHDKSELHAVMVRAHDAQVREHLSQVLDAGGPALDRIVAFLHRMMNIRLGHVMFERPRSMETSLQIEVGRMFRSLLREGCARGEFSIPDVNRTERAIMHATDMFLDRLPRVFADPDEGERPLTDKQIQVYEQLFAQHWLEVMRLLANVPSIAKGSSRRRRAGAG